LEHLLKATCDAFGSVEILVNCAGRTKRTPTLEFADEDWDAIVETNLTGTYRACRIFGRHMVERQYGRIINIGSLSSFVGLYEVAATAPAGAVASLTKARQLSGRSRGLRQCAGARSPRTDLNAALLDTGLARPRVLLRTR
jgi:NAD(P)-dependent dehydrogenase (short-subunit alcohol dehydrogenase family)